MNPLSFLVGVFSTLVMTGCSSIEKNASAFSFNESEQGIELLENGKPVYFYQKKPKSLDGNYAFANYLHPLYSLNGEILTEEFPPDHPHHRGIFWAWHQLFVDGRSLGDGWVNDSIFQEVTDIKTEESIDQARINLNVMWKSSIFQNGKPFLKENTTIVVYQLDSGLRKIDFFIKLTSQLAGFEMGGSADEKGYGGFCARIKLPDGLAFTSENGSVAPQELQLNAGPWIDFSGVFGVSNNVSGLTILCHPGNPGFPEPWILRQKSSMQNIAFPGQQRIGVPMGKPIILHYRIIVHNGSADSLNIKKLQRDFAKMSLTD